MSPSPNWTIRSASLSDRPLVRDLIETSTRLHQHLDWTGPLELVGTSPFHLALQDNSPIGCLACPGEPQGPAWIRLFAAADGTPIESVWRELWEAARQQLLASDISAAAVLCLSTWMTPLVESVGFRPESAIVFLEWQGSSLDLATRPVGKIRPMKEADIARVLKVDNRAFGYLWTMSAETLARAFDQANYVTVLELEGEIAGYQLSTSSVYGAHLARLAVSPELQGRGAGTALVQDLLDHFRQVGISRITVNTQADNLASLALYEHLGFQSTDHSYSIYLHPLRTDETKNAA